MTQQMQVSSVYKWGRHAWGRHAWAAYGPIWDPDGTHMGPIWAHMGSTWGPYGPI